MKVSILTTAILLTFGCAAQAAGPDIETVKQILSGRWMALKPDWASERNVLFENVRPAGGTGGSWKFTVTASVRDYNAGYPRNRYYGQTCVGRFDNQEYTIFTDGTQWRISEGAFTALASKCQQNPGPGVSSIPLSSLAGAPAGTAPMAAAPQPQRSGGVVQGRYECWSGSQAQGILNFTILGGDKFQDFAGKPGVFSYNPGTSRIVLKGGAWDGGVPSGYYTIYYEPQGRPTVSVRNPGGNEIAFCQKR